MQAVADLAPHSPQSHIFHLETTFKVTNVKHSISILFRLDSTSYNEILVETNFCFHL